MKCEWVVENLVFYVYDELADDARHELEQHVERCQDCALELAAVKKFRSDVAQFPATEPSPSLLAASRMKLQEALESTEQGAWWHRRNLQNPWSPDEGSRRYWSHATSFLSFRKRHQFHLPAGRFRSDHH